MHRGVPRHAFDEQQLVGAEPQRGNQLGVLRQPAMGEAEQHVVEHAFAAQHAVGELHRKRQFATIEIAPLFGDLQALALSGVERHQRTQRHGTGVRHQPKRASGAMW